jgi:hypothetical protein
MKLFNMYRAFRSKNNIIIMKYLIVFLLIPFFANSQAIGKERKERMNFRMYPINNNIVIRFITVFMDCTLFSLPGLSLM